LTFASNMASSSSNLPSRRHINAAADNMAYVLREQRTYVLAGLKNLQLDCIIQLKAAYFHDVRNVQMIH
jgi:hypothetical protein